MKKSVPNYEVDYAEYKRKKKSAPTHIILSRL